MISSTWEAEFVKDEELDDDEGFDIDEELYMEEKLDNALQEESEDGDGKDEHHAKSPSIERADHLFIALTELAKAVDLSETVDSDQLRQLRSEVSILRAHLRRLERCLEIAVNEIAVTTAKELSELKKENKQLKQQIEDSQSAQQQREQREQQQEQGFIDDREKLAEENEQLRQHIENLQSEHHSTPLKTVHDGIVQLSNEDLDEGMDALTWKEFKGLNQGVVWLRTRIRSILLEQIRSPSSTAPSDRKKFRSRIPRPEGSATPQVPGTTQKATPKSASRVAPIELSSAGKPPLIERRTVRRRQASAGDEQSSASPASTSRSALSRTPTAGRRAVRFGQHSDR